LPQVTALFAASGRRTRVVEIAQLAILETVEELLNKEWSALRTKATITSVAAQEAYDLPSDYDFMLTETFWTGPNAPGRIPGFGPVMLPTWRFFKNWGLGGTMYPRWRVENGQILIHPTPAASGTVYEFDYISNAAVYGAGGYVWGSFSWGQGHWTASEAAAGYKAAFTKDDDQFKLQDKLLRRGIRWRMLKEAGQAFAMEREEYEREVDSEFAKDRGGPGRIKIGRDTKNIPPIFSTIGNDGSATYPNADADI
jgi:hypothetical protein